jgi:hypothetical protein
MQAQDRTQPKPGHPPVVNINKTTDVSLHGLKVMIVENHKSPTFLTSRQPLQK